MRLSRDGAARAHTLLAVHDGATYAEAAQAAGRRCGTAVARLVARFNAEGLAALTPRHAGGRRPVYDAHDRARILAAVRRLAADAGEGHRAWSVAAIQRALRAAPDERLRAVSHPVVREVLRTAGWWWDPARGWQASARSIAQEASASTSSPSPGDHPAAAPRSGRSMSAGVACGRCGLVLALLGGVRRPGVSARDTAASVPSVVPPAGALGSAGRPLFDSVLRFRLRDQFGDVHDAAAYRGRPLFVVGAGRAGQASATAWVTILRARPAPLSPEPASEVVPIADLSAVPRLLRGYVRGRFSRNPARCDPERCTVLAVDAAGRPVLRASTLATDTATVAAFAPRADATRHPSPGDVQ